MNYDIPLSDDISRAIYNMVSFDANAGAGSDLYKLREYVEHFANEKAMIVCTEQFRGDENDKSYDRGFVRALIELVKFIDKSYEYGKSVRTS